MPQYSFKCDLCKSKFDAIVKFDTEVTSCPSCKGISERDHTPVSSRFVLLGPTWAVTGYDTPKQAKEKYLAKERLNGNPYNV